MNSQENGEKTTQDCDIVKIAQHIKWCAPRHICTGSRAGWFAPRNYSTQLESTARRRPSSVGCLHNTSNITSQIIKKPANPKSPLDMFRFNRHRLQVLPKQIVLNRNVDINQDLQRFSASSG